VMGVLCVGQTVEGLFKLKPEDGFMKAETCSCCVLLINCMLF